MRGDAALTARLLLRRSGLAGLTAGVGGILAAVATTRPWYVAVADLTMLGEQQARPIATLDGLPGTMWGWLGLGFAIAAAALGAAAAVDRPPRHARGALVGIAAGALVVAGAGAAARPDVDRVAGSTGSELLALAERLPSGVELSIGVHAGSGPLLLAVAALLVAMAAILADEL